jgi:hypothetical protein
MEKEERKLGIEVQSWRYVIVKCECAMEYTSALCEQVSIKTYGECRIKPSSKH